MQRDLEEVGVHHGLQICAIGFLHLKSISNFDPKKEPIVKTGSFLFFICVLLVQIYSYDLYSVRVNKPNFNCFMYCYFISGFTKKYDTG